jgi:hypothetical protein
MAVFAVRTWIFSIERMVAIVSLCGRIVPIGGNRTELSGLQESSSPEPRAEASTRNTRSYHGVESTSAADVGNLCTHRHWLPQSAFYAAYVDVMLVRR